MQQMLLQKRNDLFFIKIRLKQEGLTSCFKIYQDRKTLLQGHRAFLSYFRSKVSTVLTFFLICITK